MDPHRAQRVAETLREELAEIVNYELDDPRLGSVSITEVLLSPDLRRAQVHVCPAGDASQKELALAALAGARHYLRRLLASRLELFRVPELHFELDLGAVLADRAPSLLARIRKRRPRQQPPGSPCSPQKNPLL